tara:strand:+ start:8123 stop:10039 length:1917 start_codon:yes stop_codon:yes gene_type:complete
MKAKLFQTTFSAGEIDPNMVSRSDSPSYYNGAKTMRNWMMLDTGGIMRRPGSTNLAELPSSGRLLPFTFATGEEYIFVLLNQSLRVYNPAGVLLTTISGCPWVTAELFEINYAQYADTMYLVHKNFQVQEILRTGSSAFTRSDLAFEDDGSVRQPYFKYAPQSVTLNPSGTSGTITLTTSEPYWTSDYASAGIVVRHKGKEMLLTTFVSTTVMNATVEQTLTDSTASTEWDEQAFSNPQGHPAAITFHENRLWLAGNKGRPSGLYGSKSGSFENFDTADADDADGINVTVAGSTLSAIRHLTSARHFQIFTDTAEFFVRDSTTSPITPNNISIRQQTPFGCGTMTPLNYDGATIFVQEKSNTIREFSFSELTTAYEASSISLLAHNMIGVPKDNAVSFGNASRPETMMFLVNEAGAISVYHSLRSEQVQGWTLWTTEGSYKSITNVGNKTYILVERTINNVVKYFLEEFSEDDSLTLDCSMTVTSGSPATVYANFTHLANQEVNVVSGNYHLGKYTVAANGEITITQTGLSTITAGLNYTPTLTTLPPNTPAAKGELLGDPKRISRVILRVNDTLNVSVNGVSLVIRNVTDDLSIQPLAASGYQEFFILGWSKDPTVDITQSEPFPLKLLAVGKEVIF